MTIKTEIEYLPTPKDFAKHMWESLDSEEMADVLFHLYKIRKKQILGFDIQMRCVAEKVANIETDTSRVGSGKAILDMLKQFVEMIEEELSNGE